MKIVPTGKENVQLIIHNICTVLEMILISTEFIYQQRTYYEIKRTVTVLTYDPVLAGAITIILTDRNIKQSSLNALYPFEH